MTTNRWMALALFLLVFGGSITDWAAGLIERAADGINNHAEILK